MFFKYLLLWLTLASSFTGCQNLKHLSPVSTTQISTPKAWASAQKGSHQKVSTGWLAEFKDSRMSRLVNEALKNNHDLKAAAHRLKAAEQGTIIGRANRLPSVSSSTSYSRSDSQNSSSSESYRISLNANWEADLWGRLRNLENAERADYAIALAEFRNARLSLAANTASAWCNLVTAERQLELAKKTLESYDTALPVVERRYRANISRAVDIQFARNNVASAERSLRVRRLNRDNAARNLETLLGRYPSAEIATSITLPYLSPNIPSGIPATLLERRPDLVRARARLYASAERAQVRAKNLLPSLNLTSSLSNSDDHIRRLLDPNFILYSAAASLAQTVYRGGQLKAEARIALEENRAQLEDYAQVALEAFREVESALAADHSLKEQEVFLEKEVQQTTLAEKRAISDITLGIEGASFLEYLEAQRRAENARASLIQLRNTRLQNRIDLHLALGGDFKTSVN